VPDCLGHANIEPVFLPPYAPHLNVAGRFWPFFNNTVPHGRYYEPFVPFKAARAPLPAGLEQYHGSPRPLWADGVQVIGPGWPAKFAVRRVWHSLNHHS